MTNGDSSVNMMPQLVFDLSAITLDMRLFSMLQNQKQAAANDAGVTSPLSTIDILERLANAVERLVDRFDQLSVLRPGDISQRSGRPTLAQVGHSIKQCSELSGISESTIRRSIKDGTLIAHTVGSGRMRPTYRIWRTDFEAYLEASRPTAHGPLRVASTTVRTKSRHFD